MSWLRRLLGWESPRLRGGHLLNLRTTRFRQLIRSYGRIKELDADAAEKQSGDFVLDGQYVLSLAEGLLDLAESITFDLNVMTENRHLAFFERLQTIRSGISEILRTARSAPWTDRPEQKRSIAGAVLANAVARTPVLARGQGRVACRGLGAGTVFNLDQEGDFRRLQPNAVLVASTITIDDATEAFLGRASAILVGDDSSFGQLSDPERTVRVPTIVGVGKALQRLTTGVEVTVDADENTIYAGCVHELVDYYELERLGAGEEPEYRLLRDLRRAVLHLSPAHGSESASDPHRCHTLHDLVHTAHLLAGDALAEILFAVPPTNGSAVDLGLPATLAGHVLDLGDGLAARTTDFSTHRPTGARADALQFFLAGLRTGFERSGSMVGSGPPTEAMVALAKDQHAVIACRHATGIDVIDAMVSESPDYNHVYCRFAGNLAGVPREAVAEQVLARQKFATNRTAGATTGWIAGLSHAETAAQLTTVGHLYAYLLAMKTGRTDGADVARIADAFIQQVSRSTKP